MEAEDKVNIEVVNIDDLDYQHLGIPKEETYRQFNYDDPIKKNQ